jgi:hypothetical protein
MGDNKIKDKKVQMQRCSTGRIAQWCTSRASPTATMVDDFS